LGTPNVAAILTAASRLLNVRMPIG
jgi:hypothetical protein